jgi:uncharacterized membrane protein HdeD (DUF308 family)
MAGPTVAVPPGWVNAVGGLVAIGFGLAALFWPHRTLALLVLFCGAFALGGGIESLSEMVRRGGRHATWWPALLIGSVSILAGLYVLTNPAGSASLLLVASAYWAIVVGISEMIEAVSTGQLVVGLVGVLTGGFGVVLLGNPAAGARALALLIGVFALVRGILLLLVAFRLPTPPGRPPS